MGFYQNLRQIDHNLHNHIFDNVIYKQPIPKDDYVDKLLTGIGIFDNSFPIQFFMILQRFMLTLGLYGILVLYCFTAFGGKDT